MTVLVDKSNRNAFALLYLFTSAKHFPTEPPKLAYCPIGTPYARASFDILPAADGSANFYFNTLYMPDTESFISKIAHFF